MKRTISGQNCFAAVFWLGVFGSAVFGQETPLFEKKTIMVPEGDAACVALPLITVTKNDVVLVFATERMEDRQDFGNAKNTLISRSIDQGETWSEPVRLSSGIPLGVVSDLVTGETFLFVNQGQPLEPNPDGIIDEEWLISHPPEVWTNINQFVSSDDGTSWQKVQDLGPLLQKETYTHLPLPAYSTGFQLQFGPHNGRLVLPTRIWTQNERDFNYSYNTIIYSDDHGQTWTQSGLSQKACGESCGVELADGRVYLNNRNEAHRVEGLDGREINMRNHCISSDGGLSFTEFADDLVLVEPQCQAGMVRVSDPDDGNLICFCNPATTNGRHHLTVRASMDDCKTWPVAKLIEAGPAGYSSMAAGRNGMIYIAYERGETIARTETAVARFNSVWLYGNSPQMQINNINLVSITTNSVANSSFERPECTVTTGGNVEDWLRYGNGASGVATGYIVNDDAATPDTANGTQYAYLCARKIDTNYFGNPNWLSRQVMGGVGQDTLEADETLQLTVSLVSVDGTTSDIGFGLYSDATLTHELASSSSIVLTSEFQDFMLTWTAGSEDAGKSVYITFRSEDYGISFATSPRMGIDHVRLISAMSSIANGHFERPEYTVTTGGNVEDWLRYGDGASGVSTGYIMNDDDEAPDTADGTQYAYLCARKSSPSCYGIPNWLSQQVKGGDGQDALKAGETLQLTVSLVSVNGTASNVGFGLYRDATLTHELAGSGGIVLTNEFQDFTLAWTVGSEDVGKDVYVAFWSADYGTTFGDSPRVGIDHVRLVSTPAPPSQSLLFILSGTDGLMVTATNLTASLTSAFKAGSDLLRPTGSLSMIRFPVSRKPTELLPSSAMPGFSRLCLAKKSVFCAEAVIRRMAQSSWLLLEDI